MPSTTFILPFRPAFDSNGLPAPGAKLNFYLTGTLTRTPVYADSAMTTELPNPVVANSAGRFADIYMDGAVTYRVILTDEDDVTLDDSDPYSFGNVGTTVDLISTQSISGAKTFDNLMVTDSAYGVGWDANTGVPSKNAVYDKIEALASVYLTQASATATYLTSATAATTYVALTGAQTIAGLKTFSNGIAINGQTLDGLSAAGVAMAEAATVAAQRDLLGNSFTLLSSTTVSSPTSYIQQEVTNYTDVLIDANGLTHNFGSSVAFEILISSNGTAFANNQSLTDAVAAATATSFAAVITITDDAVLVVSGGRTPVVRTELTARCTHIRLQAQAGSLTAGTVKIYGRK